MTDRIEIFEDDSGNYRWRRIAPNNRIVSVSGEGFERRDYAEESAATYNPGVEVEEDEPDRS